MTIPKSWQPPFEIPLQCKCGAFRGVASGVSRKTGLRVVCYCDDCQAFAHHLGRVDVLDANGGTDIYQVAPTRLKITHGLDNIKCLRLTERGLLRWYAGCCHSPIANTLGSDKMALAGTIHSIMNHREHGVDREQSLGPILARIQGRFAQGTTPPGTAKTVTPKLIWNTLLFLGGGWIRRQNRPSPFFDPGTGKPRVEPYILTPQERDRLRPAMSPA